MQPSTPTSPPDRSQPIGFIGLGAMGAPMARWLVGRGWRVLVHDIHPAAVRQLVEAGAVAASSLADMARQAKTVFTCLPSLEALQAVVLGKEGLLGGDAVEVIVDFSTTGSNFAREMAGALADRGILWLDAPITGNVVKAGNGSLGIMCSGPARAYQQAEPVMRDLASAIVLYLGEENGRGQRLKLLNNLLSATGMASSCEAFIIGVKWGLAPEVMLDVVNGGEAFSSATLNKFAKALLPRRFDYGARMAITAKDTSITIQESEELGVPMWIGQAVRQVWQYAISQGGADKDGTALVTYLERWAGIEVRSGCNAVPANVETVPAKGRFVLVCDAAMATGIEARLRAHQGGAVADFRLVGVASGSDADAVVAALPASDSGACTVVNLLPMPTAACARLAAAQAARGNGCLDVAIPAAALRNAQVQAAVLVAGPGAVFAQAAMLLQALGSRIVHVTEKPGGAHLMQSIEGCLFNTLLAVSSEAFVTGAKAGLDPLTMVRIMRVESGRNALSERIFAEQVTTRRFQHGKRIEDACREFTLLEEECRALGLVPWVLDKARLLYRLASHLGKPGDDITRLVTLYEGWTQVQVRQAD